jgi:hypothetical protein
MHILLFVDGRVREENYQIETFFLSHFQLDRLKFGFVWDWMFSKKNKAAVCYLHFTYHMEV